MDVANDVDEFFGACQRCLAAVGFRFGPLGGLLVVGAVVGSLFGSLVGSCLIWQCKVGIN
jgi:hypothetical protein